MGFETLELVTAHRGLRSLKEESRGKSQLQDWVFLSYFCPKVCSSCLPRLPFSHMPTPILFHIKVGGVFGKCKTELLEPSWRP